MPSTFSPDPQHLAAGAGTAAAQAARPREVADTVNGGYDPAPVAATGATAGTPGSFTPAGATVPANRAALTTAGVVASPTSAWTVGQHVITADGVHAHWSGTAWATGDGPVVGRAAKSKSDE